jgi:hypothetical protein
MFTDSDNGIDSAVLTEEIIPQDCQQTLPNQFAWPDLENVQHHPVTDVMKTHDTISATRIVNLQPAEIFADWEPGHVNIAEKTNQDVVWCAIPAEVGAWIHAPY